MNCIRRGIYSVLFFSFLLLVGCALQRVQPPFQPKDLNTLSSAQKVDTFVVILDDSASMSETYKGKKKLVSAKEFLVGMNQTIPKLDLTAGLRLFGNSYCPFSFKTELVYGLTPYSPSDFDYNVQQVTNPSGRSPLGKAMQATIEDLKSQKGNLAVIIVTDGDDMDDSPLAAAQDMKNAYGSRLCIYTVLIGADPGGKILLENIAKATGCGASVSADAVMSADAMADFVKMVFLGTSQDSDGDGVLDAADRCPGTPKGVAVDAKGCPLDSDGDGVPDYLDKCPNTPKGTPVDKNGCPLDSDGDGVTDNLDQCPGTPKGAKVNAVGCWVLGEGNVLFDTAKWDIKPTAYPVLDEVVAILKNDPKLRVEIQGHTDNIGKADYNKDLSEKRAKSVLEYVAGKGIERSRLSSVGFGLTKPAASNATNEGRALNRRVELKPLP